MALKCNQYVTLMAALGKAEIEVIRLQIGTLSCVVEMLDDCFIKLLPQQHFSPLSKEKSKRHKCYECNEVLETCKHSRGTH